MHGRIERGQTVLFQGDSITDAGRNRETDTLGTGYAFIAAALFGSLFPELGVRFLNRGISGNRVTDLDERWQADCIALRPDWLSVYIGINDCWRRYDRKLIMSVESYEHTYRLILDRAREANPNLNLVLVEPFVLPVPEDRVRWREDLDPKIDAVRRIARDYCAAYVPLDGLFAAACTRRPPEFWAHDGVHPSPAGHALIARAWLDAIGVRL